MISLRPADVTDINFLQDFALAPQPVALQDALDGGKLRIALAEGSPVGFLSFSILWGTLPFLELFEIAASRRGRQFGANMARAWEDEMRRRGFDLVLVSTGADGAAQHFWRKMGYVDCGALTVRGKPAEVFLQRAL